jgi:hypothetical protein
VFGTKQFWCYLLGWKFMLVMDYQAYVLVTETQGSEWEADAVNPD